MLCRCLTYPSSRYEEWNEELADKIIGQAVTAKKIVGVPTLLCITYISQGDYDENIGFTDLVMFKFKSCAESLLFLDRFFLGKLLL